MKIIVLLLPLLVFLSCKKSSSEIDPDTLLIIDLDYTRQSTFTDPRDNQQYHYTTIGEYNWMTENLRFNAEGSRIYADKEVNLQWYGRLYTQEQAHKACPDGWGLPTNREWKNLCEVLAEIPLADFPPIPPKKTIDSIGGLLAFNAMRSDKSTIWVSGSNKKTNKVGFYALPAGIYDVNTATFSSKGITTTWWSNTKEGDLYYTANIGNTESKFYYHRFYDPKVWMFSVRCVRGNKQ